MARNPKQNKGIGYFPCDADIVQSNKIKLLYTEFAADGFWIYMCLLSEIYSRQGYYLDISDDDVITLLATDVCKKQVSLVREVIKGCVRRDLFDKGVFDAFNVLTSDRIQENYLEATDRRKEPRPLFKEFLLIDYTKYKNVDIKQKNVNINSKNADNSEQSKVKQSKLNQSKDALRADVFEKAVHPFESEKWLSTWEIWKQFRSKIKKPYKTFESEQAQLKWFSDKNYSEEESIQIIEKSIKEEWRGLFPLNQNNNGKQQPAAGLSREQVADRLFGK